MLDERVADSRRDAACLAETLRRDGYVVLKSAVAGDLARQVADGLAPRLEGTPCAQGDFLGHRTKRLGGILKRVPASRAFVMQPLVLSLAQAVLGGNCDRIQLNVADAVEIGVGERAQVPYREEQLWPLRAPGVEYVVSVFWPLAPPEGALVRLWRGSHGQAADFDSNAQCPALVPGDAVVVLGSALRGLAANVTSTPLYAVNVGYCLGWLKPYENQWLTYPPEVARAFDADLAALVGYRRDRPNLGSVDGACPSHLLAESPLAVTAADALNDDQAAALAAYHAVQGAVDGGDPNVM